MAYAFSRQASLWGFDLGLSTGLAFLAQPWAFIMTHQPCFGKASLPSSVTAFPTLPGPLRAFVVEREFLAALCVSLSERPASSPFRVVSLSRCGAPVRQELFRQGYFGVAHLSLHSGGTPNIALERCTPTQGIHVDSPLGFGHDLPRPGGSFPGQ